MAHRPRASHGAPPVATRSARRLAAAAALAAAVAIPALPVAPRAAAAQPPIGRALRDSLRDDRLFSFEARGPYRAQVPRPEALLGFRLGDRNTQFAEQERVLLAIAEKAADRVRVEEIGATHEGRRMRLYVISSPENIARLDAIRADLDRLSDPRVAGTAEAAQIAARTPTVVWISESVHGNESPGFESAMPLLYQLAASDEPATLAALRSAIVVLNPSTNPDGHERFTVWYNSIARSDPTNDAYEHREPWSIQGRFNHYRFDMNRDVMASTQPEVQALLRGMLRWHPQTAVDQHGHTTNYFFPPAARPVNANIGADSDKWLSIVGRANAAAFDRFGWMYFVRDQFDLYYPGYWDTWPSLTGATGMTYETDGGGWKGILWKREDGTLLSFRDGIAKHWTTAMATIEAVAARAAERLRDYHDFRRRAVDAGRTERMKRVVIEPGDDPQRAAELVAALLRSGIEVRRADQPFQSARATAYALGSTASSAAGARRFEAGAYVIDLAQPQGRLAKAFLEPAAELDSTFARTQRERFARNQRRGGANEEGYEFYDITAWSLPVAFGVRASWTEDAGAVSGPLLALADGPRPGPQLGQPVAGVQALTPTPFTADATALRGPAAAPYGTARGARVPGAEVLPVEVSGGIVGGERARSAYLFAPSRSGAPRLAFHLLADGVRVGVTTDVVEAGGRTWSRGSYLVRVARNDTTLHATLDRLARESGVEVTAVGSAYAERAQFGIGSAAVQELVRPRVAVLGDEGVAQTSYGALWYTLDRRFGVDFTHVGWGTMTGGDLSRWNVLIVPDASPGVLGQRLGKAGTDRLREWVRAGGTLVTMGGATAWAAREDVNLTSARAVEGGDAKGDGTARDATGRDTTGAAPRRATPADSAAPGATALLAATSPNANADAPVGLPGSHFDALLDRTHWLTGGYDVARLTALVGDGPVLRLSKEGSNVAIFPTTGAFHRAGFTFPGNTERLLRGTALLVEEPLGRGHVIAFANEPTFRAWWRAMDGLVWNAMLLGPAF